MKPIVAICWLSAILHCMYYSDNLKSKINNNKDSKFTNFLNNVKTHIDKHIEHEEDYNNVQPFIAELHKNIQTNNSCTCNTYSSIDLTCKKKSKSFFSFLTPKNKKKKVLYTSSTDTLEKLPGFCEGSSTLYYDLAIILNYFKFTDYGLVLMHEKHVKFELKTNNSPSIPSIPSIPSSPSILIVASISIISIENKLTVNDNNYTLDSVIFANNASSGQGHFVAGVTHKTVTNKTRKHIMTNSGKRWFMDFDWDKLTDGPQFMTDIDGTNIKKYNEDNSDDKFIFGNNFVGNVCIYIKDPVQGGSNTKYKKTVERYQRNIVYVNKNGTKFINRNKEMIRLSKVLSKNKTI